MVISDANRSLLRILPSTSFHELLAFSAGTLILAVALLPTPYTASALAKADTCFTGNTVADAANNPGLASEYEVLLAARDTLEGRATLDWSASTPIGQWEGVALGGSPTRVTDLHLQGKGLSGELPAG